MRQFVLACLFALSMSEASGLAEAGSPIVLWRAGEARCSLILPSRDDQAAQLGRETLTRYLREFYDLTLPESKTIRTPSTYIVLGTPQSNRVLSRLVRQGLRLRTDEIGEEGFQLLSHEDSGSKYLVIHAKTPAGIKHGCQELLFYHLAADLESAIISWPLQITRKPELAYRGIYILPCWSAHDSIDSWRRVLRFTSELSLNRVWFWLDGFPLAGHQAVSHIENRRSDYDQTDLASGTNVQSLIDLVNRQGMKFYIGGGWMSWHQQQVVGKDPNKSREYYRAYLRAFRNVSGFYFEPTGEGSEDKDWRPIGESLRDTIQGLIRENPRFEVAVAIGRFNNRDYLKLMSTLDPQQVYWWWCWGDPAKDKALSLHSSVLGWHTVVRMSDIHGTVLPPSEKDRSLSGMSTSYDPGMGYGNLWNGWAKMGVSEPRNFDPYTMPYFSHEYKFRERCWNLNLTDEEFAQRLRARLFDKSMPAQAITLYLRLADYCFAPAKADPSALAEIESFVENHQKAGTPRNRDTLTRMAEAISGLRQQRAKR